MGHSSFAGAAEARPPDTAALLDLEPPLPRVRRIAELGLEARFGHCDFPAYFTALDCALEQAPPVFATPDYEDKFAAAASEGQWLATSLIFNAEREGEGATRLWSLAACTADAREKELLKRHAVDESGHALRYLRLLDLTFEGAAEPDLRRDLNQLSPHYKMGQTPYVVEGTEYGYEPTIDDFIQMNIAEIRTTIHHLMQRKALANFCPPPNEARSIVILDSLLADELSHVAYSAQLVEEKAPEVGQAEVNRIFVKRMKEFSDITSEEVELKIFD